MIRWTWLAAVACAEAPEGDPSGPATPALPIRALGLTDAACEELESATFVQGGQGGFHALIGVFGEAPSPDVVMGAVVSDAETGEPIAELHEFNVMLADWDEGDHAGWASGEARIGDGSGSQQNRAALCAVVGRPLLVEGSIRALDDEQPSVVTTTVMATFDGPCG
ncbi:MAG: hypothetical protein ABMA64_15740 [Myxococcota bacterium]